MVSATEAARVQPRAARAPAHDAFTRLLHRLEPDPATLWQEVEGQVERTRGVLVLDDSMLDKPYARKMELVHRHWSGTHHDVVDGINLITMVWTDGDAVVPCDWRVFDKPHDGITKNEHFAAMLLTAKQRDFAPERVLFDAWYASVDNLRLVRDCGWRWLTQLKGNRKVNVNRTGHCPVAECAIVETGTNVWLKGVLLTLDAPLCSVSAYSTEHNGASRVVKTRSGPRPFLVHPARKHPLWSPEQ